MVIKLFLNICFLCVCFQASIQICQLAGRKQTLNVIVFLHLFVTSIFLCCRKTSLNTTSQVGFCHSHVHTSDHRTYDTTTLSPWNPRQKKRFHIKGYLVIAQLTSLAYMLCFPNEGFRQICPSVFSLIILRVHIHGDKKKLTFYSRYTRQLLCWHENHPDRASIHTKRR